MRKADLLFRAPLFAMPTPMTPVGAVDPEGVALLAGFLERHGVPTLIVNGTTGEFPSTTRDEKRSVLAAARGAFAGGVIAGISGTCIGDVLDLAADAAPHCDGFLLLPPYYYAGLGEQGLKVWFTAILSRLDKPTFLYNFPRHTGNPLAPSLLRDLAACFRHLAGIKDSSGLVESAVAFKEAAPDRLVFLGSDAQARAGLDSRIDGPVTGAGNAFPEHLVALVAAHAAGDEVALAVAEERIAAWRALRTEVGADEIAVVKAVLACRVPGLGAQVRPPLAPLAERQQELLLERAQQLGLL